MPEARGDDCVEPHKGPAGDEKNVLCGDAVGHSRRVAPRGGHGGLELARDIIGREHGHIAVLHDFEKIGLDPAARDIASAFGAGGELVHLVEINNAVRSAVHIAAGAADQVAHQVIHIAANIAGFAELRGVGFDKWHADEVRRRADEVGFADSRGTKQKDILFLVEGSLVPFQREADMLEVVAQRDGEDFLGLLLADHKPVEVAGDVGGFERKGKLERGFGRTARRGFRNGRLTVFAEFFGNARCDGSEVVGFLHVRIFSRISGFVAHPSLIWKKRAGLRVKAHVVQRSYREEVCSIVHGCHRIGFGVKIFSSVLKTP